MPIDITAQPAPGRQIVQRYGGGGFTVSGVRHTSSVLIFRDRTVAWPVSDAGAVNAASLAPVIAASPRPRILIIGCGRSFAPRPALLDGEMREAGVGVEWMDTGAACRTFNVLLLEDREVAAALIAVA